MFEDSINPVYRLMMDNLQLGLSQLDQFLNTKFSQGSVAIHLRCGGIFSGQFVSAMVKEFYNWPTFAKVMGKDVVSCFLTHGVQHVDWLNKKWQ